MAAQRNKETKKTFQTFEEMNLKEDLLRGIYGNGFHKPSAIQQRAMVYVLAHLGCSLRNDRNCVR